MSEEEHRARIDLAMEAPTLADLHGLIDDLQGESELAPMTDAAMLHPIRTAKGSRLGAFAVILPLLGVAVALIFGIRACAATDEGTSRYGEAGYTNPAVITEIADAVRAETGTTVVDRLGLYPDYAVVWMPAPGKPQKQVNYTYRDGELNDFDDNFSSSRDADEPQIDITTIDTTKAAGIIAGAAESLNLSRVDDYYMSFSGTDNGPQGSFNAENTDEERGYLTFDPAGNFLSVTPFAFGE